MNKRHQFDCCGGKTHLSALKIILLVGLCGLLVAAVMQARAHAQDAQDAQASADSAPATPVAGRVARISDVEGSVMLSDASDAQPEQAVANMPAVEGTTLETGQDGHAEIQFEDGSVARIVPNSRLQVSKMTGAQPQSFDTEVNLLSGEGYFELSPAAGSKFTVDALGLTLVATDAASFRVSWLAQPEQVAVSDGQVRIAHANDYNVKVNANETLSIDDADVSRYLLSSGTDADANDAWDAQRDDQQGDADQRTTEAAVNPDNSDLNLYGNFYDVPSTGQVWQPYGYGADWSPFDAGYWAWYPWGYTWISAYPWGWLPFHCGYWNYFDGLGWGWVNTGCAGGWYPIDIWYGGPGGWHGPRRPPWHPRRPPHRIFPVGGAKEHPFQPQPVHRVPVGFKPQPVHVGGKVATPLPVVPPVERSRGGGANGGPEPVNRSAFGHGQQPAPARPTIYGSRAGNPELGRGHSENLSRPAPTPPAYHPPPPPPPSHSESHSESHSDSGSHK
jgi:hypothetical protein